MPIQYHSFQYQRRNTGTAKRDTWKKMHLIKQYQHLRMWRHWARDISNDERMETNFLLERIVWKKCPSIIDLAYSSKGKTWIYIKRRRFERNGKN